MPLVSNQLNVGSLTAPPSGRIKRDAIEAISEITENKVIDFGREGKTAVISNGGVRIDVQPNSSVTHNNVQIQTNGANSVSVAGLLINKQIFRELDRRTITAQQLADIVVTAFTDSLTNTKMYSIELN